MKKTLLLSLVLGCILSCAESVFDRAPFANAGDDQSGYVNFTVVLDGSLSYDPDGDFLTYSWEITSKPANSSLSTPDIFQSDAEVASFLPDAVGVYTFTLTLTDSDGSADKDDVNISIETGAPVGYSTPGLHLNEILTDYPYAVELYNTTASPISLSEYDLVFRSGTNELIVPLNGSVSAPALDYFTIFHYFPNSFNIPVNRLYRSPSSFSTYLYNDFSLILRFKGNPVDYVQVDSIAYSVPSAFTWNTEVSRGNRDYLIRSVIDMTGPLNEQWSPGIGTLGLSNSTSGNVDIEVTLW